MKFLRQTVSIDKMPQSFLAKWPADILSEGFVPLPKKVMRTLAKLFPHSKEVKMLAALLSIVDFTRANQSRYPSLDFLSFIAGLPEAEFREVFHELASQGFIAIGSGSSDEAVKVSLEPLYMRVGQAAIEEQQTD